MNVESWVWLALAVIFLIVEANTVSVVSAWFCVGALAAMTVALLGGQLWLQITVFVVVSALTLAALRPVVKKFFNAKLQKTNLDAVIGSVGVVLEPVDQFAGRVKLGGMEWSARSQEPICEGTLVRVDRIEGVKVFVTPAEETANTK